MEKETQFECKSKAKLLDIEIGRHIEDVKKTKSRLNHWLDYLENVTDQFKDRTLLLKKPSKTDELSFVNEQFKIVTGDIEIITNYMVKMNRSINIRMGKLKKLSPDNKRLKSKNLIQKNEQRPTKQQPDQKANKINESNKQIQIQAIIPTQKSKDKTIELLNNKRERTQKIKEAINNQNTKDNKPKDKDANPTPKKEKEELKTRPKELDEKDLVLIKKISENFPSFKYKIDSTFLTRLKKKIYKSYQTNKEKQEDLQKMLENDTQYSKDYNVLIKLKSENSKQLMGKLIKYFDGSVCYYDALSVIGGRTKNIKRIIEEMFADLFYEKDYGLTIKLYYFPEDIYLDVKSDVKDINYFIEDLSKEEDFIDRCCSVKSIRNTFGIF